MKELTFSSFIKLLKSITVQNLEAVLFRLLLYSIWQQQYETDAAVIDIKISFKTYLTDCDVCLALIIAC